LSRKYRKFSPEFRDEAVRLVIDNSQGEPSNPDPPGEPDNAGSVPILVVPPGGHQPARCARPVAGEGTNTFSMRCREWNASMIRTIVNFSALLRSKQLILKRGNWSGSQDRLTKG
jgi:hypothetical protein